MTARDAQVVSEVAGAERVSRSVDRLNRTVDRLNESQRRIGRGHQRHRPLTRTSGRPAR